MVIASEQSRSMSINPLLGSPNKKPIFCSSPLKYCWRLASVTFRFCQPASIGAFCLCGTGIGDAPCLIQDRAEHPAFSYTYLMAEWLPFGVVVTLITTIVGGRIRFARRLDSMDLRFDRMDPRFDRIEYRFDRIDQLIEQVRILGNHQLSVVGSLAGSLERQGLSLAKRERSSSGSLI